MRDMTKAIMICLVCVLAMLFVLCQGCSHARYSEKYHRGPGSKRTFRVTFPSGNQFLITPVEQVTNDPAAGKDE